MKAIYGNFAAVDSRHDARAIAAAIVSHADAIEGYATDTSVTDEVFTEEALGRIHLIQARLARLREALEGNIKDCP